MIKQWADLSDADIDLRKVNAKFSKKILREFLQSDTFTKIDKVYAPDDFPGAEELTYMCRVAEPVMI